MPKFLVLGLPRSRTAWLANFLTYDGNYCYHEAISRCRTFDDYLKMTEGKGDSTTALLDVNNLFPDVPKVIIERDPDAAIRFGLEVYGSDVTQEMLELKDQLDEVEGMRVPFDEIDAYLPEIWGHLIGTEYDAERAELLMSLNVQIQDPYTFEILEDFHVRAH